MQLVDIVDWAGESEWAGNTGPEGLAAMLRDKLAEGWELEGVDLRDDGVTTFVFKRPPPAADNI